MSFTDDPRPRARSVVAREFDKAVRDKRIVGSLFAAVGIGAVLGLAMKPTLGDRPPAAQSTGINKVGTAVTNTGGLEIMVSAVPSEEGRLPAATTLLPAPIQGMPAPAPAPLVRVSAPARSAPLVEAPDLGTPEPVRLISALEPRRPVAERPRRGEACAGVRSYAEAVVCAEPRLTAADRRLRRAYERALDAGVPEEELARRQTAWLTAREAAARDDPAAVEEVYEERISELEDMSWGD